MHYLLLIPLLLPLKNRFIALKINSYRQHEKTYPGFIQGSLSKIQGLFKDFPRLFYSFQDLKVEKNTDGSVKILLQKCQTEIMVKLVLENEYEIVVPLFGAAFAAPSKGTTILYWFKSLSTVLSSTETRRKQDLFKALRDFPVLFKADWIFKDFSRKPSKFKYFSSLCEPWYLSWFCRKQVLAIHMNHLQADTFENSDSIKLWT